jgi:chaperone BCS1
MHFYIMFKPIYAFFPTSPPSPTSSTASASLTTNPILDEILQPTQNSASSHIQVQPSNSSWLDSLKSNPIFTAGAGVAGIGVALQFFRRFSVQLLQLAQKRYSVSLEIPSKDRSYQWVLQFLARSKANSSAISNQHQALETHYNQLSNGAVEARFDFIPSTGNHWFWYKKRLILTMREREKSMIDLSTGLPFETVTLRTFGRSKAIFAELLAEAKQLAMQKSQGKTILYHTMGIDWKPFGQPRKRRPLHSVILAENVAENIEKDFGGFLSSQQWYLDRGIPYRRGYLFYGPPGCGKTSFIFALAGELEYNICVLNLNDRGLTDDKLAYVLATVPPRSIILLEDIDAAFTSNRDQSLSVNVTFSGLLNALDGITSTEERVIFMTTNHISKLDPALIRPGRVDIQQEITHASPYQLRQMFLRFFPAEEAAADYFTQSLAESKLSVAELQGFFLLYKENLAGAMQNCEELKKPRADRTFHSTSTAPINIHESSKFIISKQEQKH